MQYDSYAEDARDKMFHISQMLGSAIWFSGLADEAATEDDGDLFYYFCSLLQILACSDDPGLHIFSYGSLRDAYSTYDESAAYFRGRGSREQNLDWVVESAARMVLFVDDSPRDERISIVHSLASEAGYAIPDAMEIVDKLMHELDAPFDSCEEDGKDMDRIVPGFFLFLEKFRMFYAIECETEMDNVKALEKATERISLFILENASDMLRCLRESEDM